MEKRKQVKKISVEFTTPEHEEVPIHKAHLTAWISEVVGWQNIRRLVFPHQGEPVANK